VGDEEWISYEIEFRDEAQWSDGTPITGRDYLYTLNMVKHPSSRANRWRSYFSGLKEIKVDTNNPKKLTVSYDNSYMLSREALITINILPAHIYDPLSSISNLDLTTLSQTGYTEKDSTIIKAIETVNGTINDKTDVVQAGPYRITAYEPNQYYILERVPNYWGKKYKDIMHLNAYASKLTFKIVPDDLTAVTMCKEDKLDVMMLQNSGTFFQIKNDSTQNDKWNFHTPQLMTYLYVGINNKRPILKDKRVRNALAHLVDVDDFIESLSDGLGSRTIGPFHPTKAYYNDKLKPIPLDIAKAKGLLAEAGWE